MQILFGLLQLLVPLMIIGGIVAAVVAWRRREGDLEPETEADRGIGTVKRLYFYVATFAYLIVAGVGVALLARYVLDELFGPTVLSRDESQLALGVALAAIWTPIWAWHRLRVQRFAEEEPTERRSILRKLYVYLTLAVTAALVAHASVELLRWAFGARSFSGYAVAALVVWGGLWVYHWLAESAEGQPTDETRTVRRLYLYVTSAYSLTMLAVGLSLAIYLVLREAYEGLFSVPVLLQGEEPLWGDLMRNSLSVALVGAGLWGWHWLYAARLDAESTLRQFYLYALAVLGGVITTLVATGVIAYGVLVWLIGVPEEASATAHFHFLPGALSPLLIGISLWLYHWQVVQHERAAAGQLPDARRIYAYVMAALGLGALAAALIVLVPTVIGIGITSAREVLVENDWWRNRIALVVTLALVGGPVWAYYWFSMQRSATIGGPEERASLPRRVLVYGVLGVGTLAVLGNISYLLYTFLDALLEGTLSLTLLREAKWAIGNVVAAGLIVPYYGLILREDRRALPQAAAQRPGPRKPVTVLVAEGSEDFINQLEAALKGKVHVLQRAEPDVGLPELSVDDLRSLEQRISQAAGTRVLLVADAMGVQTYSYR
ncbi:MAG: DUF5671 domain-containing protein [Chloroflexota bacterium]|nr:DUF5671 domain-containing protein [Chloroflexota bacterium]